MAKDPIFITLKEDPLSVNSIYMRTRERVVLTPKARLTKTAFMWEARSQYRGPLLEGDVDVDVTLFFRTKTRRDGDNAMKLVFDSLTDIVYKDDSQITDHHVHKRYDPKNPRVEIIITPL